ncbi:MAG TPA: hypothetical protein VFZ53_18445 [Polyangiaceae bacterium]
MLHFELTTRGATWLLCTLPLASCGVRPSFQVLVEPAVEVASRANDEGHLSTKDCALHCGHVARQRTMLGCRIVALDETLDVRLGYDEQHMVACRFASEP